MQTEVMKVVRQQGTGRLLGAGCVWANPIYSGNWLDDHNNILKHIKSSVAVLGIQGLQIDLGHLQQACLGMYQDFPPSNGHGKATAFKKVGAFVALFMHYKPIKSELSGCEIGGIIDPDLDAVIAMDIAITALEGSRIFQNSESEVVVSEPIYLSDRSYADEIDAFSLGCEHPTISYLMLAIYFEQLVYKTNPHCQYATDGEGQPPVKEGFFQTPCPVGYGDDLMGV
tara:strand:+ start:244 stop:924 length:681 start_codon:yes stop_codon:yes gene_type:complete